MIVHKIDETVSSDRPCHCCGAHKPWYLRLVRTVRCGLDIKKIRGNGAKTYKSGKVTCGACRNLKGVGPKRRGLYGR